MMTRALNRVNRVEFETSLSARGSSVNSTSPGGGGVDALDARAGSPVSIAAPVWPVDCRRDETVSSRQATDATVNASGVGFSGTVRLMHLVSLMNDCASSECLTQASGVNANVDPP